MKIITCCAHILCATAANVAFIWKWIIIIIYIKCAAYWWSRSFTFKWEIQVCGARIIIRWLLRQIYANLRLMRSVFFHRIFIYFALSMSFKARVFSSFRFYFVCCSFCFAEHAATLAAAAAIHSFIPIFCVCVCVCVRVIRELTFSHLFRSPNATLHLFFFPFAEESVAKF